MTDNQVETTGIAVIGMACRFPGAEGLQAFWENLRLGVETISFFEDEELEEVPEELLKREDYVRAQGVLENIDLFDADFFGWNPREAQAADPQQRLFLECGWHALEHAGYDPATHGESTGVFAGSDRNLYQELLRADRALSESLGQIQVVIGTDKDHLAPRLSYLFNLCGPSIPVQTACSTSLVAVHLACQSLLSFECNMALAGGCSIPIPAKTGYLYQQDGIQSPDGHCRAFDAGANGTVPGSGVGLVVLKRLADARADGDTIHGVILASAVNNDGSAKVGYTAPGVSGQRWVIREALSLAGLPATSVTYVETHGTGTALGDPIEVKALSLAFRESLPERGPEPVRPWCALGSVKTNLGHCNAAAGIAGLIKTLLCLEHRTLVPSLHFNKPNPAIAFEDSPFYVNTETRPWPDPAPIAGVSSFGIGGTNAHLIVTRGPEPSPEPPPPAALPGLLTLSARTAAALRDKKIQLASYLEERPDLALADVLFTLNAGRKDMPTRLTRVVSSRDELRAFLLDHQTEPARIPQTQTPSLVWMFPGQGVAYGDFGRELYRLEPVFRREVDRCCDHLRDASGLDLERVLFAEPDSEEWARLATPVYWQPALFVSEYALARLWSSWGLSPEALIGHSIGEYVAATLAGVFSLENALTLMAERGRLTAALAPGAMLAVAASAQTLAPWIDEPISLAAENGPELCILSGPSRAVARLETALTEGGHRPIRVHGHHAFHSAMVEPLVAPLTHLIASFELFPPQLPLVSNLSGTWLTAEQAVDPAYWGRQLRRTVRFRAGLETITEEPGRVFLEIGPGQVLTRLVRRHPGGAAYSCTDAKGSGLSRAGLLTALGALWRTGLKVDWEGFYRHEHRRRVPLPLYPFERRSFWPSGSTSLLRENSDLLDQKAPFEDWLYLPTWHPAAAIRPQAPDASSPRGVWLFLSRGDALAHALGERLTCHGATVITVEPAASFERRDTASFGLNPNRHEDYDHLFQALDRDGKRPRAILHGWCLGPAENEDGAAELSRGFDGVLHLIRALDKLPGRENLLVRVLTEGLCTIGAETSRCFGAALVGALRVIPKEYPHLHCGHVDLEPGQWETHGTAALDRLVLDLEAPWETRAYRRGRAWLPEVRPLPGKNRPPAKELEGPGVFLITNAFQRLGAALALRLAAPGRGLILVDRSFFPPQEEWEHWIRERGDADWVSRNIALVRELLDRGVQVRVIGAAPARERLLREKLRELPPFFASIRGVFHLDHPSATGLIQGKSPVAPSRLLREKMDEAQTLCRLAETAGFLVFFAENAAEAGGLGQVEQAAAFAFLQTLARTYHRPGNAVTCIDWGTRAWDEPLAPKAASPIEGQLQEKRRLYGMSLQECLDTLMTALSLELPHLIVSTRDYAGLMAQQAQFTTAYFQDRINREKAGGGAIAGGTAAGGAPNGSAFLRPDLANPYRAPTTDVQRLLCETWQGFFGIAEIGIDDNFFELGGHSLLALQLLTKMNQIFSVKLTLNHLFDFPTVAQLAATLVGDQVEMDHAEELERILAEIEGLSGEQIQRQMESDA